MPVCEWQIYVDPPRRRYRIPVGGPGLLVGRSPTADILIADPACARQQLRLEPTSTALRVVPLSMSEPVIVDGHRIENAVIVAPGALIRFGYSTITVKGDPPVAKVDNPGDEDTSQRLLELRAEDETRLARPKRRLKPPRAPSPIPIGESVVVGRAPGADGNLLHPTVSRYHAQFRVEEDGVYAEDLRSTNGIYVDGERVQSVRLRDGNRITIGPYVFRLHGTTLLPVDAFRRGQVVARDLLLEVRESGKPKKLVDHVSFRAESGEFVVVVGPSGSGKSSLLRSLCGRWNPKSGTVGLSGRDLYSNLRELQPTIAFVPQREELLRGLTVRQMLDSTARLRLPADTRSAERREVVATTIAKVALNGQADQRIDSLSGGQRKRVALANELLVSPDILFVDEATSGLDEVTDREVMLLLRQLARQGTTVVCVTHTLANVMGVADSVVGLAPGGIIAFHGTPTEACHQFEIPTLSGLYRILCDRPPEDLRSSYTRYIGNEAEDKVLDESLDGSRPPAPHRTWLRQLAPLLARNTRVALSDRRSLLFSAVQCIVVGVLLRIAYQPRQLTDLQSHQFAFLLAISAFWFGANNAAKEIVLQRGLFELERAAGLRPLAFLTAKFLTLFEIGLIQVGVLTAIALFRTPHKVAPGPLVLIAVLAMAAGTACGLACSAAARTSEQAVALIPIVLIPQLLLSDFVIPSLPPAGQRIGAIFASGYWIEHAWWQYRQSWDSLVGGPWWMLVIHTFSFLMLARLALQRSIDPR
jgi:ABC-type multidrug transport system ATPase subunit